MRKRGCELRLPSPPGEVGLGTIPPPKKGMEEFVAHPKCTPRASSTPELCSFPPGLTSGGAREAPNSPALSPAWLSPPSTPHPTHLGLLRETCSSPGWCWAARAGGTRRRAPFPGRGRPALINTTVINLYQHHRWAPRVVFQCPSQGGVISPRSVWGIISALGGLHGRAPPALTPELLRGRGPECCPPPGQGSHYQDVFFWGGGCHLGFLNGGVGDKWRRPCLGTGGAPARPPPS